MKQSLQIREDDVDREDAAGLPNLRASEASPQIAVALLTGGIDRPYTFGLVNELVAKGASLDVIGSDDVDFPEFHATPGLNFLNLYGSQRPDVGSVNKVLRLAVQYAKLVGYALTSKPAIFHILWNNKFELFDRTLLTIFYRFLRKRVVLTVHNVNAGKRDSKDTQLNRLTLRIQYRLADHVFVHTESAKVELRNEFGVQDSRMTVIPFGINNAVPNTALSQRDARLRLGIRDGRKTILFFGRITPYKGLEYLVTAFQQVQARRDDYRLIIAGRPENDSLRYWNDIQDRIGEDVREGRILLRPDHIPDEQTELYFKAADVLVLPYKQIYQSGVLFLGYSFGLPILAADLSSLKDEIVEGSTGFVFKREDSGDLARTIERYFASDLFAKLSSQRQAIRDFTTERHSWDVVGQMTMNVYENLLRVDSHGEPANREPVKKSIAGNDPS